MQGATSKYNLGFSTEGEMGKGSSSGGRNPKGTGDERERKTTQGAAAAVGAEALDNRSGERSEVNQSEAHVLWRERRCLLPSLRRQSPRDWAWGSGTAALGDAGTRPWAEAEGLVSHWHGWAGGQGPGTLPPSARCSRHDLPPTPGFCVMLRERNRLGRT